ncbi:hypothetical protein EI534_40260, partial [Pseudomonas frederiksbergensis]|nr:hypothetical protein [Pseudomonas frederiksbergensis]
CNVAPLEPGKLTVARLCAGVRDTHLQVDHPALRRFIRLSQGEDAQRADSHNARHEGFSAGGGDKRHPERSWGHGSIEEDLKYAGFNEQQR